MNDLENNNLTVQIISQLRIILDLICESERERDVQDLLAINLDCQKRKTLTSDPYPDVEVDLLTQDFAIEVKYNTNYYSGISQVLAQKHLYDMQNVYLIHVHDYLNDKFINAFGTLSKELNFIGILINKKRKKLLVFNHDRT
ncbi:MAG: hypothetical protein R6U96_01870 [Promethearchaeia archaeon]